MKVTKEKVKIFILMFVAFSAIFFTFTVAMKIKFGNVLILLAITSNNLLGHLNSCIVDILLSGLLWTIAFESLLCVYKKEFYKEGIIYGSATGLLISVFIFVTMLTPGNSSPAMLVSLVTAVIALAISFKIGHLVKLNSQIHGSWGVPLYKFCFGNVLGAFTIVLLIFTTLTGAVINLGLSLVLACIAGLCMFLVIFIIASIMSFIDPLPENDKQKKVR